MLLILYRDLTMEHQVTGIMWSEMSSLSKILLVHQVIQLGKQSSNPV